MKKTLILIIISIVIGCLLAKFMFNQYSIDSTVKLASNNSEQYFFIQLGVYSNRDNMIENTEKLPKYIYMEKDNMFYVYGCITKNEENIAKIENYFKESGFSTYSKEFNIDKIELKNKIEEIDLLLNNTNDIASIKELCNQGLTIYKEGK